MRSTLSWFKKKKTDDGLRFVALDTTDSTNRYCLTAPEVEQLSQDASTRMVVVSANHQTDGRGQGTNHWESAPGQNLLFSIRCHPTWVPVRAQFVISECMSLAIKDALSTYTDDITIKWPNDIYYKDSKICGILIENRLASGCIKDCVVGVGLNVNQLSFQSNAPNPVSLCHILGHEVEREPLLRDIVKRFDRYLLHGERADYGGIAVAYAASLYRASGFHAYRDADGDFEAAIVEVEDDGHLILRDRSGVIRKYAFKEVEFMI